MQDLAAKHEAECNLPRVAAECKPCAAAECKPCAAPEEEVIWFRHERVSKREKKIKKCNRNNARDGYTL